MRADERQNGTIDMTVYRPQKHREDSSEHPHGATWTMGASSGPKWVDGGNATGNYRAPNPQWRRIAAEHDDQLRPAAVFTTGTEIAVAEQTSNGRADQKTCAAREYVGHHFEVLSLILLFLKIV
jgi:hypothetical protein